MRPIYMIHKKQYEKLTNNLTDFDFLWFRYNDKSIPVVIVSVTPGKQSDQLELTIEPIYPTETNFPAKITIQPGLYDFDLYPIKNPVEICTLLNHYLRTKLTEDATDERESALLRGFIKGTIHMQRDLITK